MTNKLTEAIERVRATPSLVPQHEAAEVRAAVRRVCDAAAREAQCRAALRSAEEECAMLRRECDEAIARAASYAAKADEARALVHERDEARTIAAALEGAHTIHLDLDTEFGDQLTVEELRELMQAKATLAGIEWLLREGWTLRRAIHVEGWVRLECGRIGAWKGAVVELPTHALAVQAALAELVRSRSEGQLPEVDAREAGQ